MGMRRAQRGANLLDDLERLREGQPPVALETLPQRFGVERHDEIESLRVVDEMQNRHNVGVIQRGDALRLPTKAFHMPGADEVDGEQRLDGDIALQLALAGPVD